MLRNLRNLIKAGISPAHNAIVIKRLRDERAVINARQMPFRYFAAYQALTQLEEDLKRREVAEEAIQSASSGASAALLLARNRRARANAKNAANKARLTPAAASPARQPAPEQHANSNASLVLGGGPSSPSAYSLDGPAAPSGRSGGYSLEGGDRDGFAMDTVPPTALRQSSGAGAYVFMVFLGAAACFGILIALQGVPW